MPSLKITRDPEWFFDLIWFDWFWLLCEKNDTILMLYPNRHNSRHHPTSKTARRSLTEVRSMMHNLTRETPSNQGKNEVVAGLPLPANVPLLDDYLLLKHIESRYYWSKCDRRFCSNYYTYWILKRIGFRTSVSNYSCPVKFKDALLYQRLDFISQYCGAFTGKNIAHVIE